MNVNPLKIAIAGCGGMAYERAKSLQHLGVEVVCVYSRTKGKASAICESTGALEVNRFDDVLTSSADAVVLCVPNSLHAEFALKALDTAKHVLVEYPLCLNLKDSDILADTALQNGKVLMVGNTIIHEKMFAYLISNKERIGTVLSAASRVALYDPDIASAWYMDDDKRGNVFTAFHYHHIEYYRHLLGEALWVQALGESRTGNVCGGELLMGHEGGATSCIHWYLCASKSNRGVPRCLWLNGTESSVTIISDGPGSYDVFWDDGENGKREKFQDDFGINASSIDFINAINGELDHRERFRSDMQTLHAGFAAAESSKTGKKVMLH